MPVSAKMRLGMRDTDLAVTCAQAIEASGACELVVHGRTQIQGYKPPAYWDEIGRVRASVSIPVIANGEIWSVADAQRCRMESGCMDLMLGRGMVADPGLAWAIRHAEHGTMPDGHGPGLSWSALQPLLLAFWDLTERLFEPRHRAGRIKQWLHMLARRHPEALALHAELRTENDPLVMEARLFQAS
jgi:tRNA-dihydrouridine synthase C